MRSSRLRHDGNPVLEWCLGNVVGKADRRGNLYPTKQRPEQKIDAAVALDRIESDREALLEFLRGLIRCPSPNPPGDAQQAAATSVGCWTSAAGPPVGA